MRTQMLRRLSALFPQSVRGGPHGAGAALAAETAGLVAPPVGGDQREHAQFLLSMAAEIEHSLMIQYLYSAWSLGGPQVPEAHRADVETWRLIMLGVAKEEMGHLLTVQNLLRLIGGPVHLDREDFPWISGFYPYAFSLEPASRATVAKYVIAESPEKWPDTVSKAEKETIENLATIDTTMQVARVGVLYEKLIELFSDPWVLKDDDFRTETYPQQATFDDWGRGYAAGARGATADSAPDVLVLRAGNRAQAVFALKQIAEQGEATQLLVANSEDFSLHALPRSLAGARQGVRLAALAAATGQSDASRTWSGSDRHYQPGIGRLGRDVQPALPHAVVLARPCFETRLKRASERGAQSARPRSQSHLP